MRIYVTYCSARKDDSLKDANSQITPDILYTGNRIQGFMRTCKERGVYWAIFSDLYGIWFPNVTHTWYEKDPDTVTEQEFRKLLDDFDEKLQDYDELWFYYNPSRFHKLYRKLLRETKLVKRVRKFSHIREINTESSFSVNG